MNKKNYKSPESFVEKTLLLTYILDPSVGDGGTEVHDDSNKGTGMKPSRF